MTTINMDWFYSNALGGVRLLVLEKDVDDAKAFLEKDFSEDLEQEFGKNKEQCPNCGSILKPTHKGKNQPLWLSCSLVYLYFLLKMVIDANNANIFGVND